MTKKRDTYLYELRDGHQIVYSGISGDPVARARSHGSSGCRFTHMNVIRGPMLRENAEELEYEYIMRDQAQHGGIPPRKNRNKTY